jgi:alkaline phosphatase D
MDWFVIGDRADRSTTVTWTRSMATRSGTGKLHEVSGPVGP